MSKIPCFLCRRPVLIPVWGTGSHMLPLKIPQAATKSNQMIFFFLKKTLENSLENL